MRPNRPHFSRWWPAFFTSIILLDWLSTFSARYNKQAPRKYEPHRITDLRKNTLRGDQTGVENTVFIHLEMFIASSTRHCDNYLGNIETNSSEQEKIREIMLQSPGWCSKHLCSGKKDVGHIGSWLLLRYRLSSYVYSTVKDTAELPYDVP